MSVSACAPTLRRWLLHAPCCLSQRLCPPSVAFAAARATLCQLAHVHQPCGVGFCACRCVSQRICPNARYWVCTVVSGRTRALILWHLLLGRAPLCHLVPVHEPCRLRCFAMPCWCAPVHPPCGIGCCAYRCVNQRLCTNPVAFPAARTMACQCAPVRLPCDMCCYARTLVSAPVH